MYHAQMPIIQSPNLSTIQRQNTYTDDSLQIQTSTIANGKSNIEIIS